MKPYNLEHYLVYSEEGINYVREKSNYYHGGYDVQNYWNDEVHPKSITTIITPAKYETVDKGYDEVTTTTAHTCTECGDAYTTSSTEQVRNS